MFAAVDCWGEVGNWDLAFSYLDRPINLFRGTELPPPHSSSSSDTATTSSSAEASLEVSVYLHRFHNLDLFQQGWYKIKVTANWEGSEDIIGVPSRVVQCEDGKDDTLWQIDDVDHSFCTRPFHIKYARQNVHLGVMVSFELTLKTIKCLLSNAVIIGFDLLHAPVDQDLPSKNICLEYSTCSTHEFRIPPTALIGLHSYCPVLFDSWHTVLVDATIHSVFLKLNSALLPKGNVRSERYQIGNDAGYHHQCMINKGELALWKILLASFNILKHNTEKIRSSLNQPEIPAVKRNPIVSSMIEKLSPNSLGNDFNVNINRSTDLKVIKWSQDALDTLKLYGNLESIEMQIILPAVSRSQFFEALHALNEDLLLLWNDFLKFQRLHRLSLCQYYKDIWESDRSGLCSVWLIHCKMDFPSSDLKKHLKRLSHNMQLMSKPIVKKTSEEESVTSASRADLHRKALAKININNYTLQDMQIFTSPAALPILYIERHTVLAESSKNDATPSENLENIPPSGGKVLRIVVFVHGFQGHHLDLRLIKNQWLLMDPDAECLMSEANEDRTMSDFRELGHRLAEEVVAFINRKITSVLKKYAHFKCKLSFVGHSMGNLIIRTALNDPTMEPFLGYLHTFVSMSGPHLGFLYNSNTLFNSGLWLLKKLKASPCMHQLTFTDEANIEDCFIYKLSEKRTFEYFQNVFLLSSPQDRYVPYHSARVEMCQAADMDSKYGSAYSKMLWNCINQMLKPSTVDRVLVRCDVNFDTSQALSLNNLIGRTAHIEFLETDVFVKFLMWTFSNLFK